MNTNEAKLPSPNLLKRKILLCKTMIFKYLLDYIIFLQVTLKKKMIGLMKMKN